MWKYVSRRIRDVCDRTFNTVLDVHRPWQCGGERFCSEGLASDDHQQQHRDELSSKSRSILGARDVPYCLLSVIRNQLEVHREKKQHGAGSNDSHREGFRRKEYFPFQPSWARAITWTSAIICGWYTSQVICLYRRSHRQWEGPKCLPRLISSAHNLPGEFEYSRFLRCHRRPRQSAAPLEPAHESQQSQQQSFFGLCIPTAKNSRLPEFDFTDLLGKERNIIFEISNDGLKKQSSNDRVGIKLQPVQEAPTIATAVENLISVIGEIEYQLGVQNLEIGDYRTAVSHLKLGTSHHHAGAAYNLGICYEQGHGVKKNARMAMECFHLASTLGHAQAMYNLGVYYVRGLGGLRRSCSMAKKYFKAAAELGLEEAIIALGPGYNKQPTRRSSLSTGSSSASPHSFTDANKFQFNYDDILRYGGFDAVKAPPKPETLELRLVSVMG